MAKLLMKKLPKELVDYIFEYSAEHREMVSEYMKELRYAYTNRMLHFAFHKHVCDGYDCGNSTKEEGYSVYRQFGYVFIFCSSYCDWDVTYDIKKQWRRRGWETKYRKKIEKEFDSENKFPSWCNSDNDMLNYCSENYQYANCESEEDEEYYDSDEESIDPNVEYDAYEQFEHLFGAGPIST